MIETVYLPPRIPFGNPILHLPNERGSIKLSSVPESTYAIITGSSEIQYGRFVRAILPDRSLLFGGRGKGVLSDVALDDCVALGDIVESTYRAYIMAKLECDTLDCLFKQKLKNVILDYPNVIDSSVYFVSPPSKNDYVLLTGNTDGDDGEPLPLRCVA